MSEDTNNEFLDYGDEEDPGLSSSPMEMRHTCDVPQINSQENTKHETIQRMSVKGENDCDSALTTDIHQSPKVKLRIFESSDICSPVNERDVHSNRVSIENQSSLLVSKVKLDTLSKAISEASSKKRPTPNVNIVLGLSATATTKSKPDEVSSSIVMLKNVPIPLLVESKIAAHLSRYGSVEKVEIFREDKIALIHFNDKSSAVRAFVNRAPIMKDKSIRVFKLPNYCNLEERDEAMSRAVECSNRTTLDISLDPKQSVGDISPTIALSESAGLDEQGLEHGGDLITSALDNTDKIDENNDNLFEGISVHDSSASNRYNAFPPRGGKYKPDRITVEKRTWRRAGLVNLKDKEVLKARMKEKLADAKVQIAKKEVENLLGKLAEQKEQFSLILKSDTTSIRKKLRAELTAKINLLMAQLRSAQGSMASAKAGVATAKKLILQAIENSRESGENEKDEGVDS